MADNEKQAGGIARREVLRRGAAASVATAVGVPVVSGSALAHECPRTPGYWKNHDWPDTGLENVNQRLPGVTFESVSEGQEYLSRPTEGDTGVVMAHHLIAAVLNFQNQGSFPDEQPTWTVASAPVQDGEVLKDALDDFNNTRLGLDCDCE